MKGIIKSIILLIFSIISINAISQGINFQGVARSANGTILASQNISLKISLIPKSVNSIPEYVEIRTVLTNAQGIFTIVIGEPGTITTLGSFSNVNWKEPLKYLKVEMDPNAGLNFITMGVTQLQNVPFSYYSYGIDASNVNGVLPIKSGGTGVSTLDSLKISLKIPNYDTLSLSSRIDVKLNKSDTSSLSNRINAIRTVDTTYLSSRIDFKLNKSDTSSLSNRINAIRTVDTTYLSSRIDLKLNKSDTSSLSNRINLKADGSAVSSGLNLKLNTSDTTTLSNRINLKLNTSDTTSLSNRIDIINSSKQEFSNDITVNGVKIGVGSSTISGTENRIIGNGALAANTTGSSNVAIGDSALFKNTNGYSNVSIGKYSLFSNRSGYRNTAIGDSAFISGTGFFNSTAIGYNAIASGSNVIQLGDTNIMNVRTYGSIQSSRTISAATINASTSSAFNGSSNVFKTLSSTNDITVNGILIGRGNGSKDNNLAIGENALINTSSQDNMAIGDYALWKSTTAFMNTALGIQALKNTTTGGVNTAVGFGAMFLNTSGSQNTALGSNALSNNTSGSENTALGLNALSNNTTGDNNTAIGNGANVSSGNLTNTITIGYNAIANESNSMQIGNSDLTKIKSNAKIYINGIESSGAVILNSTLSGGNTSQSKLSGFAANYNEISGSAYTLQDSDNGKLILINNSTDINLTIPALFKGFNCMIIQGGLGQVILNSSGSTINNRNAYNKTSGQYAILTIVYISDNIIISGGDMSN
jgi:hypothetical protein